jgi:hypothetical protein
MDLLLLGVTAASLTLALGMTFVAWKLRRDARRRSDARVAVLETLAFSEPEDDGEFESTTMRAEAPVRPVPSVPEAPEPVPIPAVDRLTHAPLAPPANDAKRPVWDGALGARLGRSITTIDVEPEAPADDRMFVPAVPTSSSGPRRVLVLAAVVVVMIGGVSAAYVLGGDLSIPSFATTAPSAPQAQARQDVAPLELLSLRHTVGAPGQFTVTGLVQNPQLGRHVSGLVVVVYLFDAQGRYLASGKTPLEYPSLRPGDEAPFVVTIPASGDDVSRYRVGFRLKDGAVVAHVDRRGQPPASTTGEAIDPDQSSGAPRARRIG